MIKKITMLGAAIAAGLMLVPPARAGCGVSGEVLSTVLSNTAGYAPTATGNAGTAGSLRTMLQGLNNQAPPTGTLAFGQNQAIVGMWHFTVVSEGNEQLGIPDGAVLDDGYQTWHGDGTELTNSLRAPPTGNFCMGVWGYQGDYGYRLNHYALSWDPTGTVFIGPANIREHLTVGTGGNEFSGTQTVDQYAADGVTLLVHLSGTVSGTRINVE